jgi:hypothetical protein
VKHIYIYVVMVVLLGIACWMDYQDHKVEPLPERAKVPATVEIGPFTYRILLVPFKDDKRYGRTDPFDETITINSEMAPDAMRETTMHEIFHACRYSFDFYDTVGAGVDNFELDGDKKDDLYIEAFAPCYLGVLRDNPAYTKWLMEKQ